MKRLWVVGLIPPVVVLAVGLLIIPGDFFSAGAVVGLISLAVLYAVLVTLPLLAPRSEKSLVLSGSYALAVWPYVIAAALIALLALFINAISWKWVLAGDIIVAGLALATVLLTTSVSEKDAKLNADTKRAVSDLRRLALTVEDAGRAARDVSVRAEARKVAEQIRLSPFNGVSGSRLIESEIEFAVSGLSGISDPDEVGQALDEISRMVDQRNQIVRTER